MVAVLESQLKINAARYCFWEFLLQTVEGWCWGWVNGFFAWGVEDHTIFSESGTSKTPRKATVEP